MNPTKESAMEAIGKYMDDASSEERKELLLFLEGFSFHAKIVKNAEEAAS